MSKLHNCLVNYIFVLDKRNTAWLRDTVRQTSLGKSAAGADLRSALRPLTSLGTSAWPYRVTTQYSYCMCIYMHFLSTVQFVQVKVTFLFAALCVPNIVTTYSPWQGYGCVLHLLQPFIERYSETCIIPWASYQIRKIAGCACAGNAGNVFPGTAD